MISDLYKYISKGRYETMKKTQKKLGNKGFSLVELIVVIAIMAVLVGVLAPTLIRNVEKSRESTDIQNLDSIRTSVVNALNTEAVEKLVTADTTVNYKDIKSGAGGLEEALYTEMESDGTLGVTMKSGNASAAGDNGIKINISQQGKVTVYVADNNGIVSCKRTANKKFTTDDNFTLSAGNGNQQGNGDSNNQ